jgi:hypothetical protein
MTKQLPLVRGVRSAQLPRHIRRRAAAATLMGGVLIAGVLSGTASAQAQPAMLRMIFSG